MSTLKYTYWEEDGMWLGYLEEVPDYMTQGTTREELEDNLRDIYRDLTSGAIPAPRRVGELLLTRNGGTSSANLKSRVAG